jgi:hypothetical protein
MKTDGGLIFFRFTYADIGMYYQGYGKGSHHFRCVQRRG